VATSVGRCAGTGRWPVPGHLAGGAARHRFIRESRVAASVDHPNIIPIFAAGEADGFLFIAMRFVQPLGLVFYDHGLRLMVADAGRRQGAGGAAVVDVSRALAVRPALLGTVPTGARPQQVALYPGGKTLLITDTGSRQLHVIRVAQLP
jgi:hypothetical protein